MIIDLKNRDESPVMPGLSNEAKDSLVADLKKLEYNRVPNFKEIMSNRQLIAGIIHSEKAHIFTDDRNNTIVVGYSNCPDGNPDGDYKCTNGPPNIVRLMLSTGIFNLGYSDDVIQQNMMKIERGTGSGWAETYAGYLSSSDPKKGFYGRMIQHEKEGYSPIPYLYVLGDAKITTIETLWNDYGSWVIAIAAIIVGALTAGILSGPLLVGAKALLGVVQKYTTTGQVGFSDLLNVGLAMGMSNGKGGSDFLDNAGKIVGVNGEEIKKAITAGTGIYTSIQNKDYAGVFTTLGMPLSSSLKKSLKNIQNGDYLATAGSLNIPGSKYLNETYQAVKRKDVQAVSNATGIHIDKTVKAFESYKNAEMVNSVLYDFERMKSQAEVFNDATIHPAVQQYIANATGKNELTSSIPGSVPLTALITNNTKGIDKAGLKGLVNTLQSESVSDGSLDSLFVRSCINEAKQLEKNGGNCYVLPPNTPDRLVSDMIYIIEDAVPGVWVNTTNPNFRFYKEFP